MSEMMVSVCMITYNHEAFISEAIEGVLMQQTSFPIELVIGEDCSTDRTREICMEYRQKHPGKIRLLLNEKNLGMMPNFIQTLKACTGKYIALCEGDDFWTDKLKLQKQVEFLEGNEEYGMVYTRCYDFYENEKKLKGPKRFICHEQLDDLLLNYTVSTLTTCLRADLLHKYFKEFRPLEKNWLMGDLPLFLYFAAESRIKFLNEVTAVYRVLEESASRTRSEKNQFNFTNCGLNVKLFFIDKYLPEKKSLYNAVLGFYLWGFFINWCRSKERAIYEGTINKIIKNSHLKNSIKTNIVRFIKKSNFFRSCFIFFYVKYRTVFLIISKKASTNG